MWKTKKSAMLSYGGPVASVAFGANQEGDSLLISMKLDSRYLTDI